MLGTSEPRLKPIGPTFHELAASIRSAVNSHRLKQDVIKLLGPHNRLHSPEEMVKAEESIISSLHDAGWQVQRRPYQLKNVKGIEDYGFFKPTIYPSLSGVNITAIKPGTLSDKTILVEAHYDTIWFTPGADDNTASVAAILELARVLQPYKLKHSVMLAACDMEELGFIGDSQLVAELKGKHQITGAIVFDTMAYTSKKPNSQSFPPRFKLIYPEQIKRLEQNNSTGEGTFIIYRNAAKKLAVNFGESLAHVAGSDAVMMIREPGDLPIVGPFIRKFYSKQINDYYRADHIPFWAAKIPAVQITDGANFRNPNYHKPSDLPNTLDYETLANIVAATAITILRMGSN